MRQALNSNPRVQLAVFGIGAVVLVLMLMSSLGGRGGSGASTTTPSTAAATTPTTATTATPDAAATTPATPAPAAPAVPAVPPTQAAAPPADAGASSGLLPSAGLPKDVLVAYAKNEAIALLVIDPKSFPDKQVRKYTEALRGDKGTQVFIVKAKDIADYARITQGVAVDRTPALVVIRPAQPHRWGPDCGRRRRFPRLRKRQDGTRGRPLQRANGAFLPEVIRTARAQRGRVLRFDLP